VTVRIQAWVDGPSPPPDVTVIADGHTLAHAVRQAVHALRVGVGRTVAKEEVAPGDWLWNWSGTVLRVREIAKTEPMFTMLTPMLGSKRRKTWPVILDLRGDRRVTVTLSGLAHAELRRGAAERGSPDAYVEALLLQAARQRGP
jgi:hypothetical protein